MGNNPPLPQPEPRFTLPQQNLTIEVVPRHMKLYQLNESEIDSLNSSDNSLSLTFLGLTGGAFGSFLSVVVSGSVPDPKKYAVCLAVTIATGLLAAFFGISAFKQRGKASSNRQEIKERKIVRSETNL